MSLELMNPNQENNEKQEIPSIEPVEASLFTGLYGSGKTELISEQLEGDEEAVFIGSETADVGLDGGTIDLPEGNIVELYNVCMACNPEGEFDETIKQEEILEVLDRADRVYIEGPGNAGTRDLTGTINNLPELELSNVGRVVNLENWEGEKAELKDEDLISSNYIAVNRPTEEHGIETVKNYLEEQGIDTPVVETPLESGFRPEEHGEIDEWTDEMLVESMGPAYLQMTGIMDMDNEGHDHKPKKYGKLRNDVDVDEIEEIVSDLADEELEGLRIKMNTGDRFVNIVNGELSTREFDERAPGYLIASNFGEIPDSVEQAFSEIESLESTAIRPGATRQEVVQSLQQKYENAADFDTSQLVSQKEASVSMPDPVGSAYKTAVEASETFSEDDEVQELHTDIAQEYVETAMETIFSNRRLDDNRAPLQNASLAAEIKFAAEDAKIENDAGNRIAYETLARSLSEFDESHVEEFDFYSDGEDFHEYFGMMLDEGLETGAISKSEYQEAVGNITEHLRAVADEESVEHYGGVEA